MLCVFVRYLIYPNKRTKYKPPLVSNLRFSAHVNKCFLSAYKKCLFPKI